MKRTAVIACFLALVPMSVVAVSAPAQAATCANGRTAVAQTSGPYYTPHAPVRRNVRQPGTIGTPLVLTGAILDSGCRPIPRARVEFWQADGNGVYDNTGFTLRGTQYADRNGRYRLVTVIPGQYPGRTEHIHVKITPPGQPAFITQLYFPGSTSNDEDGIFSPQMVISVSTDTPRLMRAAFTFVLPGTGLRQRV